MAKIRCNPSHALSQILNQARRKIQALEHQRKGQTSMIPTTQAGFTHTSSLLNKSEVTPFLVLAVTCKDADNGDKRRRFQKEIPEDYPWLPSTDEWVRIHKTPIKVHQVQHALDLTDPEIWIFLEDHDFEKAEDANEFCEALLKDDWTESKS